MGEIDIELEGEQIGAGGADVWNSITGKSSAESERILMQNSIIAAMHKHLYKPAMLSTIPEFKSALLSTSTTNLDMDSIDALICLYGKISEADVMYLTPGTRLFDQDTEGNFTINADKLKAWLRLNF